MIGGVQEDAAAAEAAAQGPHDVRRTTLVTSCEDASQARQPSPITRDQDSPATQSAAGLIAAVAR